MLGSTNLNIRTSKEVKQEAESICLELGINMTTAINMFLRALVRQRGIPFKLQLENPRQTTIKAIEEARKIAKDDSIKGYSDIDSLRKALEV